MAEGVLSSLAETLGGEERPGRGARAAYMSSATRRDCMRAAWDVPPSAPVAAGLPVRPRHRQPAQAVGAATALWCTSETPLLASTAERRVGSVHLSMSEDILSRIQSPSPFWAWPVPHVLFGGMLSPPRVLCYTVYIHRNGVRDGAGGASRLSAWACSLLFHKGIHAPEEKPCWSIYFRM